MSRKQMTASPTAAQSKRAYVSQADVPINSLDDALRLPNAIFESYNGRPSTPLQVASFLAMSPTSGTFRNLCGSAIAYGLTTGGYNAQQITVEALAKRILKPTVEGDDLIARREAVLKPRVLGEFLRQYSGGQLPRMEIAANVLVEMGVPRDRANSVFELILESAEAVGFIKVIKGKQYVELAGVEDQEGAADERGDTEKTEELPGIAAVDRVLPLRNSSSSMPVSTQDTRRVFITHGKNKSFLEPIKKLLAFGELSAVVSVERQTVSKAVPDKVLDDMRSCGAAIIHVDEEQKLMDSQANEQVIINPNVLIEIGAAMALYGKRFILLVREGITLPSNLQGLYEVRYCGEALDGDATIRLLSAINDIKNYALPGRDSQGNNLVLTG